MQEMGGWGVIEVVMKTKRILLLIGAILSMMVLPSCLKNDIPRDVYPKVRCIYAGEQEDNEFQLWIWLFEDQSWPARVVSGVCRYVGGTWIDTDEEYLTCKYTDDGFTLCNDSGQVLYTATYIQKGINELGYYISITWTHSPGPAWDANATARGWQREMELWKQSQGEG